MSSKDRSHSRRERLDMPVPLPAALAGLAGTAILVWSHAEADEALLFLPVAPSIPVQRLAVSLQAINLSRRPSAACVAGIGGCTQ